jgi:GNAT superfamily N-acetyltransferase
MTASYLQPRNFMPDHEPLPITIREARSADAAALAVLRYRFRAELGAPVEGEASFVGRAAPWLRERLGRPPWRAWVAEGRSGAIAGTVFLQLVEKLPNPVAEAEAIGYITNLFVERSYRGCGIGGQLLQTALAACAPDEVDALILWPTPESVALYRRAGFAAPESLLERPLR